MSEKDDKGLRPLQEGEEIRARVVRIYAAVTYEDRTEGRGRRIDDSYHLTERKAAMGAHDIGWGLSPRDGDVEPRLALKTEDGRYFLLPDPIEITIDPEAEAKLREQGLAKLTPAERAALLGKE
ncbi:MAG: hypothetical protein ACM3NH_03180 [Candidatus Saccharibacteria bacterium]